MWLSQRGSPERSQERHRCWRCRSATSVCRTGRGKSGSLEMALPSSLRVFLCLWGQPLSAPHIRALGLGCHLSLRLQGKWRATLQSMRTPAVKPQEAHVRCPLCSQHSPPLGFSEAHWGPDVSYPAVHLSLTSSQSHMPETWESQVPASPHSVYHQILTLLLNHLLHPPFATSLPYNTIISCLKISVAS